MLTFIEETRSSEPVSFVVVSCPQIFSRHSKQKAETKERIFLFDIYI